MRCILFASFQAFTAKNNLNHQLMHLAVSLPLERACRLGELAPDGKSGLVLGVRPW